jgi:TP901 family phage tail tape measure protein
LGPKCHQLGSSLQTRLALPLLAIGGAATKMGLDFDRSMTKIKTLVGIASDEVDAMGQKVKQMARETGVGSTEAADALFFITSAGLRGSEALDTLNVSLKSRRSWFG